MTSNAARQRLAELGVALPPYHSVRRLRGDTYWVFSGEPGYIARAAAALRRAGYYAEAHEPTDVAATLIFNLAGTEGMDGLIDRELASIPLREPPPDQHSLFDE